MENETILCESTRPFSVQERKCNSNEDLRSSQKDNKKCNICEEVTPIEKDVNVDQKCYLDRYFTVKYYRNKKEPNNDLCVLIYSNGTCIITLAPSHPLVKEKLKINKIDFQASLNKYQFENKRCKRKRYGEVLYFKSPICIIECTNNKRFSICSPIRGKLLELNEKLLSNPDLLHNSFRECYNTECYVAILVQRRNTKIDILTKYLLDESQYQAAVRDS